MADPLIVELPNPSATTAMGRRLGAAVFPGAVIALVGPLGAGKTHLVRAIAEGLNVPNSRYVNSPTFVLIQEYAGRLPIFHFDAYRLRSADEFFDLGADEYFSSGGVCLIEWADRVAAWLPEHHLRITLSVTGDASRRAALEGRGANCESLAALVR
jgi:tRNA threonylcarbamoyladenosine biosynthesis protein TsaE